ncbi:hypothetical protein SSP35_26_00040 [Streptomyces sp. NBRC 110611]|uniref:DUF5954 family protein n=1 Tax=Streptomyces sp. NBRC 110611 TaxID=1621259 RepID=UPI00082C2A3F|nr:DUF5954 family protein [Streptomyces sp. NBRC 110611]GAU71033.1 hypothetical protein SSP35_26_00040 [Streptomyces sp. NBRC 110611]
MDPEDVRPGGARPVMVRIPVEPVEAAVEADAVDALAEAGNVAVRGPRFGVASQGAQDGPRWRVVVAVTQGCPQQARDSLNSLLWFRAKDETQDREERRALLAAVARLESERVDELTVLGTRYRIVRAEEYAGIGADGIELPRPTDPEPATPDWDRGSREAEIDDGLVLDPDAPVTPSQAAERLTLRGMAYAGSPYPDDVLADSHRALDTHPDVLLLPATFLIVERTGTGWKPGSGLHATAQEARKTLDFSLTYWEPRMRGLIPMNPGAEIDARTLIADGAATADSELAAYARASDQLRAGRINQLEVHGTVYRIGRARRLLRWGPDGPEGPRPSDTNSHHPDRIHPSLDEDGNVSYEGDADDED